MTTCLRAAAVLALGILISIGLLYLLVPVRLLNRLVTAEVYRVAISDTDAYNRVYDEVLADETLRDQTDDLLGTSKSQLTTMWSLFYAKSCP